MELKDLVKNEFYIVKYQQNYIIKFDGNKSCYSNYINIGKDEYSPNGNFRFTQDCKIISKATEFDKKWLLSCEKANKFIPQDQIPNNESLISNLIIW